MVTPLQYSFAWQIPWMEEPGRLQSMGSLRVGHNWATLLSLFTFMHWRRKWQPTPVFLPAESQGRGSLVGCRLWGCTESDRLKQLNSNSNKYQIFFIRDLFLKLTCILSNGNEWFRVQGNECRVHEIIQKNYFVSHKIKNYVRFPRTKNEQEITDF